MFDNHRREKNHLVTIKLVVDGPSDMVPGGTLYGFLIIFKSKLTVEIVEKHLAAEASVVARLIEGLQQCFKGVKDRILVCTPHRAQRALINANLHIRKANETAPEPTEGNI